jgi:hypothetical protein
MKRKRGKPRGARPEKCAIPLCGKPVAVQKHGLCHGHLSRLYRDGTPGTTPLRARREHPPFAAR